MSRSGNNGSLFAVSGRMLINGRKRRHGLYHQHTNEIFRPRWGPISEPPLVRDYRLLKWLDGTIKPMEMLPPKNNYDKEARLTWPLGRAGYLKNMYYKNEQRYFLPATLANDDRIREYLYNILEPSYKRPFSGIGIKKDVHQSSQHLNKIITEENNRSKPHVELGRSAQATRFRRLERLMEESDTWRTLSESYESSTNPFPHVNESASLIRNLALSEILYVRSNHRLNRKAHPKWYNAKYYKFIQRRKLLEKLQQLQLEAS